MSLHGLLLTFLFAAFWLVWGWDVGAREFGDQRGILGYVLGGVAVVAGVSWMAGW